MAAMQYTKTMMWDVVEIPQGAAIALEAKSHDPLFGKGMMEQAGGS